MLLDLEGVADYLLERGLVKPQAIVEGEFRVEDVSRLNRVFLVTAKPGRSYVLKHSTREAQVLGRLSAIEGLRGRLPPVVGFDADHALLILEATPGAQDLGRCQPVGRYSRILARETARSLAALHRLSPDVTAGLPPGTDPSTSLRVHRLDFERMHELSFASVEAVRFVQGLDGLDTELDALVADATTEATIHGDVRWANCLGLPSPARRTRVQLIDWEFAAAGDPAADVGEFFGEYLLAWLPGFSRVTPAALERSRAELARLQLAVGAFWTAYAGARDADGTTLGRLLRRAVRYAGARVIVAAVESAQTGGPWTPRLEDSVRFGAEVLRRPDQAGVQLLGLRPAWAS